MTQPTTTDDTGQRGIRLSGHLDLLGYTFLALLIADIIFMWSGRYFDPWLQHNDVRISIFPFWTIRSPRFDDDYIAQAMFAFVPWAYRGLVIGLMPVFDLLTIPKLLQAVSLAWCGLHAFRIGRRRAGGAGALLLVYLALHCVPILHRSAGGLPRAFAFPAILLLLDAMDEKRERLAGAGPVVGAAFYPPAAFLAALTYGFWMLGRIWQARRDRALAIRSGLTLAAVAVLTLLFIAPSTLTNPKYGRIHTYEEAQAMPEFGPRGRLRVTPMETLGDQLLELNEQLSRPSFDGPPDFILRYTLNHRFTPFDLLLLVTLGFYALRLSRLPPGPLILIAAGFLGFALAQALAFRLYSPGRMLLFSIPAAVVVLLGCGIAGLGWKKENPLIPRVASLVGFGIFAASIGVVHPGPPGMDIDAKPERELHEYLWTLPPDVLLAGHPERMDNVPLWGRRSVLISWETSQPWFTRMWEEMRRRTDDLFRAYYAVDAEPLRQLRDRYGVDFMLVHEDDFSPGYELRCRYFAPFDRLLDELCEVSPESLIWNRITPEAVIARKAGYLVIDLEKALETL